MEPFTNLARGPLGFLALLLIFYFLLKYLCDLKNKGMDDYLNNLAESNPKRMLDELEKFARRSAIARHLLHGVANTVAQLISYKIKWAGYVVLSQHALDDGMFMGMMDERRAEGQPPN